MNVQNSTVTQPATTPEVIAYRLDDMVGGWFVGSFSPAALACAAAEVGVKHYRAGDVEASHVHRIGTEVTLLLDGRAEMCGRVITSGDILVLGPGLATGFRALTDCTTVVVKTPSVPGDKYDADPTYPPPGAVVASGARMDEEEQA